MSNCAVFNGAGLAGVLVERRDSLGIAYKATNTFASGNQGCIVSDEAIATC
jgi:hypothetical protein